MPDQAENRVIARALREDGFSLMEIIISLIILAILMAIAIPTFFGSKEVTNRKAVIAAATTYSEAISAFQLDNARRVPVIGSADWHATVNRGPVDRDGVPYMRNPPEAITGGRAGFCAVGGGCNGEFGRIEYQPLAAGFRLNVYAAENKVISPICVVAVGVAAGSFGDGSCSS